MTTSAVNSEMDAALALLELSCSHRERNHDNCEKRSIAVDTMEGSTTISRILSSLITKPTQLPHSSTPKQQVLTPENRNENFKRNHSEYVTEKVMCDKGTQTEFELYLPEIEKRGTINKELRAKVGSLETTHKKKEPEVVSISDSSFVQNSNVSSEEYSETQYRRKSYKRKKITTNTDLSSVSDDDSPLTKQRDDFPKKDTSTPNEIKQTLKSNNMNKLSNEMVLLGEGNASVSVRFLKNMDWSSYTNATRKLLTAVFSRKVLATHSLTGKPSPAFPHKPAKKKLDPAIVNDIVQTVVEKCSVPESVVRTSVTTKCADESKMFKTRKLNKKKRKSVRKENISSSDSDDSYNLRKNCPPLGDRGRLDATLLLGNPSASLKQGSNRACNIGNRSISSFQRRIV